jgi:hypothetical protein
MNKLVAFNKRWEYASSFLRWSILSLVICNLLSNSDGSTLNAHCTPNRLSDRQFLPRLYRHGGVAHAAIDDGVFAKARVDVTFNEALRLAIT